MTTEQVMMWAGLYRDMLMHTYEGTLDDVFDAAYEWLAESRFFPTVGDLRPLVEKRVLKRLALESTRAAHHEPLPPPKRKGEVDWTKVPTHRLPFTHDYTKDPHWQAGIALMSRAVQAKGDLGPLGNMAREMAQRMGLGDE